VNEKVVYILRETYKDNDPDTIGAYNSMKALCRGFAQKIAESEMTGINLYDMKNEDLKKFVVKTAEKVAKLIPDLLHVDFADDECCDGRSVYGIDELQVNSIEEDEENG